MLRFVASVAFSCLLLQVCTGKTVLCPENETYDECGTSFPRYCHNRTVNVGVLDRCVEGCFCQKGYYRDDKTGKCILESDCDKCGTNEQFTTCGSACPDTCQNLNDTNRMCTMQCVRGCFCKQGYVRTGNNGRCVPRTQCSNIPKCGENEEYAECESTCPQVCNEKKPTVCTEICKNGCNCKKGYVRSEKGGQCISEAKCKECGKDKVYKQCGTACPGTCAQPSRACAKICSEGCFCKKGYLLRNENSTECVKKEDCHVKSC